MKNKQGFTLIELAIVLVIIALVVGGILYGQDMVRTAQLRSDLAALEKLNTAVSTFRSKYSCLPGDCAKITDYFSAAVDGNGDGRIDGRTDQSFLNATGEGWASMDHMARAQLINNQPFDANSTEFAGISKGVYPMPSQPNAGIALQCAFVDWPTNVDYRCHFFRMGLFVTDPGAGTGYDTNPPFYSPSDAYYIDSKLDDGKPATGKIIAVWNGTFDEPHHFTAMDPDPARCVTNTTGNPYNLSLTQKLCGLRVTAAF